MTLFKDKKKPDGLAVSPSGTTNAFSRITRYKNGGANWFNSPGQKRFRAKAWKDFQNTLEREGVSMFDVAVIGLVFVAGIVLMFMHIMHI